MRASRFVQLSWLAVALASCGAPQNSLTDLAQPNAARGTIVMSVARPMFLARLMLAPYDPDKQDTKAGFMGGYVALDLGQPSDRGFVWKSVRPGIYVLHSYLQQGIWDLCFAGHTQSFTIAAGQTLYLGRFDAAPYATALHDLVDASDQLTVHVPNSGKVISYIDGVPPAQIAPDPDAITPAHTLSVASTVTLPNVQPAAYTPAAFELGTDYLGESGSLGAETCFGANPGLDVRSAQ